LGKKRVPPDPLPEKPVIDREKRTGHDAPLKLALRGYPILGKEKVPPDPLPEKP
jgi:hypothetical protein